MSTNSAMSSSTAVSSSTATSYSTMNTEEQFDVQCGCGVKAPLRTALTNPNVGRRFLGCVNYKSDNGCKYFHWVDPPTCERGKEFGKWIVKKNMDLQKDVEDLRRQNLHLKRTETYLKGEIRVLKERENEFGQKMEQWHKREEWFVTKINCMNRKMKEMEDGITVKMEEWKKKEDLNALEIEEVETQNVELRVKLEEFEPQYTELSVKMEDVEAKNESLRGRTKAMKEDTELANLKVKWFTALVVILVGLGIVYFGGKGWLKKKLLALP
ncbi:hypothetical protein RHMOL_Rhmol01G0245500 [Rhododendron molle]|uniref:Uncharacterized protein n=1 Tax=Rhododendron molle TaxID=49168 RepID=A0ACC0Q4N1_RHOML|nr:hypothetical protein RHMOL_Rhmol01G0245500 [Rhododendron molle]